MSASKFFFTGGTLDPASASYVRRKADDELYQALVDREFCYVLDSRQKGKSSLMAAVRNRLLADGLQVALIDLQKVGTEVSSEGWYATMADTVDEEFGAKEGVLDAYFEFAKQSPMRGFFGSLDAYMRLHPDVNAVVFIDEIDLTRKVAFSTDEFFAAIRECHNRRATDGDNGPMDRLTFCLIGSASPSDLIEDVRVTPFNIGRRIELLDFTLEESLAFAAGLGSGGDAAVRRVFHWANGHPFLTQKICQALNERESGDLSDKVVDEVVAGMFFTAKALEDEPNLSTIRRRVLEGTSGERSSEEHRSAILDLYSQVLRRGRVQDDRANDLVGNLKLAGLVEPVGGYLQIRNRIYERVFSKAWVLANMPDAELQRQRGAARRAAVRVGSVAAVVLVGVSALAVGNYRLAQSLDTANLQLKQKIIEVEQKKELEKALDRLEAERTKARDAESDALLAKTKAENKTKEANSLASKLANTNKAEQRARFRAEVLASSEAFAKKQAITSAKSAESSAARAKEAMAQAVGDASRLAKLGYYGQINLVQRDYEIGFFAGATRRLADQKQQGFEWLYWDRQLNRQLTTFQGHNDVAISTAFSPDQSYVMTASYDNTVCLWDTKTGSLRNRHKSVHPVVDAYILPGVKGITLITTRTVARWDPESDKEQILASFSEDDAVTSSAISANGKSLILSQFDHAVVVSTVNGEILSSLKPGRGMLAAVQVSPFGTMAATMSLRNGGVLYDAKTGKVIKEFDASGSTREDSRGISSTFFWPDGSRIATGGVDGRVIIWSKTGSELDTLRIGESDSSSLIGKGNNSSHTGPVSVITLSPDGKYIVTAGYDDKICIWDASSYKFLKALRGHTDAVTTLAFTPDSRYVISGSDDGSARAWSLAYGEEIRKFVGMKGEISDVKISPDGRLVLACSKAGDVRIWDVGMNDVPEEIFGADTDKRTDYESFAKNTYVTAEANDSELRSRSDDKVLVTFKGHSDEVLDGVLDESGDRVATCGWDKTVKLWDVKSGRCLATMADHKSAVQTVRFSHDKAGRYIVSAADDRTAIVWDTVTNRRTVLTGHSDKVRFAAFSTDDSKVVTASYDKSSKIWDRVTGKVVLDLLGNASWVHYAWFTPQDKYVLTAGQDGTIRLFDAKLGQETLSLVAPGGLVDRVYMTDDSLAIIAVSGGTYYRWQARNRPGRVQEEVLPELDWHTTQLALSASDENDFAMDWHFKKMVDKLGLTPADVDKRLEALLAEEFAEVLKVYKAWRQRSDGGG